MELAGLGGGDTGGSSFGFDYGRARENSTSTSKNLDSQLTANISTSKMHKYIGAHKEAPRDQSSCGREPI